MSGLSIRRVILMLLLSGGRMTYAQQPELTRLLEISRTYVNAKNADSAIYYGTKAQQVASKNNDTVSRIKALGYIGKALLLQKNSNDAGAKFFEALSLCRQPKDNDRIAYLYGEVGYLYFVQGHYKEGKQYYLKSLALRKELHQEQEVCNALINISSMCRDHKEYDEAVARLEEVRALLPKVKGTATAGYFYLNRGVLFEQTGHADSAAAYYRSAYELWKAAGNEAQMFKTTFNLGYLAEERKDHKEALKYFHLAEVSAMKFATRREIAQVYGTIAEAYAGMSDYKNGYTYLHRYAELTDSLSKEEFNDYVISLDKKFQTAQSQKTIQEQQLKLQTAHLAMQEQRTTTLIILLVLVVVSFGAIAVFVYLTFRKRVDKEVEEAKGRFFANVVHEIRTPLAMIQGPIKVLQEKTTDTSMLVQLDIAERNTQRLGDLINQMLDISKIESSAYRLNEGVGKFGDFVEELANRYSHVAADKSLRFTKEIEVSDTPVLFDKDAFEKVIGNLLSNAIRYTPAGGSVGINVVLAGNTVEIAVWDTGPGVAKEEQLKIFDRFYRTGEQASAGIKGIGIGLALVKELVALMHGTIEVDSEPGKGAVFTVTVALKSRELQTEATFKAKEDGDTVLLVEDDPDILDFNRILLTERGYKVVTATNGDAATAMLKEGLPDIIITDLMMPGKDGLTLLKEIRIDMATRHIPVIILTAKASGGAKMESVLEGAQVYLSKPFQPKELVALVENQLLVVQKQTDAYKEQSQKKEQTLEDRFAGNDPFTHKCYALIVEHLDDAQLSVERLAELMTINRSHFQRKIKTLTGYSPSELIRTIRLERAKELLLSKEGNITEIAYSTGFTSQSYFTKCFSEHFGFPPSQLFAKA
jgi:two-component system sensor histidine kinase ChiS